MNTTTSNAPDTSRDEINRAAIEHARRIILRATGKDITYYATRSRRDELSAYRAMFAYLAIEAGASYVAVGKALSRSHTTAICMYENYTLYAHTWRPLASIRNKVIQLSRQCKSTTFSSSHQLMQ